MINKSIKYSPKLKALGFSGKSELCSGLRSGRRRLRRGGGGGALTSPAVRGRLGLGAAARLLHPGAKPKSRGFNFKLSTVANNMVIS